MVDDVVLHGTGEEHDTVPGNSHVVGTEMLDSTPLSLFRLDSGEPGSIFPEEITGLQSTANSTSTPDMAVVDPRRTVLQRFTTGQAVSLCIGDSHVGTASLFLPTSPPPEENNSWDELETELRKKFNRRVHGKNLNEMEKTGQVLLSVRNCVFEEHATDSSLEQELYLHPRGSNG